MKDLLYLKGVFPSLIGGHLTDDPGEDAYAGVVAPEAVRLGMFAAVHNNLQVVAADIGNAYT